MSLVPPCEFILIKLGDTLADIACTGHEIGLVVFGTGTAAKGM